MAILAGIDEAGFGPTLGPLVISGVAFRVPDDRVGDCLWKTLHASCTASPRRSGHRLAIADSKKLYRPKSGFAALERAALVMLSVAGRHPANLRSLLDILAPGVSRQLDLYPWYRDAEITLPVEPGVGDVGTRSNAVRRDCEGHGVSLVGVFCEPVFVGAYNQLVRKTKNKAVALLGLALRVIDRIMRLAEGERVRLCVDRLGGRVHYREALSTSLPGYELQILEESPTRSAYCLTRAQQTCEIEFATGGEDRHFAVALASAYSKYVRELCMRAFNDYWSRQIPSLHPTAGYYTDAKRWLTETSGELDRRGVDRNLLVRDR